MKKLWLNCFMSLMAGGLYALAYPSFLGNGWLPLVFISIPIFLWKLEESNFSSSLLVIFAFNLGLNIFGYYWIPHTLREFGQLPYFMSLLLGTAAVLILQPHWWIYAVWRKFRPSWNWSSERNTLLSALIMTILERFINQQFPSFVGSPWLHLAPYLGLAPYFGVVIFSFMTYWLSLEIIIQLKLRRARYQVWIGMVLFVLLNGIFPLKNSQTPLVLPVRIVQANIGNFLKVASEKGDIDSFESIEKIYYQLSVKDNGFSPQLIVWPETAYPHTFFGQESTLQEIFRKIMKDKQTEILIGGYDQDLTKSPMDMIESVFNSSLLMDGEKIKSIYHKNILIPFGETLPFGPFNRWIISIVPQISLFARGEGSPLMETKTGFRFVTPICYEILESNFMRSLLNQWGGNHFIVNHTNDSWYGNTAEPQQHLFLSKWRALEFQLPIIRSTNTGISSVIYPDGSESPRLNINQIGILDELVPLRNSQATIYQTYGVWSFLLLFILLYLVTLGQEKLIKK